MRHLLAAKKPISIATSVSIKEPAAWAKKPFSLSLNAAACCD
jgi:hypothetical protein